MMADGMLGMWESVFRLALRLGILNEPLEALSPAARGVREGLTAFLRRVNVLYMAKVKAGLEEPGHARAFADQYLKTVISDAIQNSDFNATALIESVFVMAAAFEGLTPEGAKGLLKKDFNALGSSAIAEVVKNGFEEIAFLNRSLFAGAIDRVQKDFEWAEMQGGNGE